MGTGGGIPWRSFEWGINQMSTGSKKKWGVLLLAVVLSGCLPWGGDDKDDQKGTSGARASRLSIALGSRGGVNYVAGNAVCVSLQQAGSGLPCTLKATTDWQQNVLALAAKQVDMALLRADAAYLAWHGRAPFEAKNAKLRVLFSIHHEILTLMARKSAQILSFAGLSGKSIQIGSAETLNGQWVGNFLDFCPISEQKAFRRQDLPIQQALTEGEGVFQIISHPDEAVKTITQAGNTALLPVAGKCVEQMVDQAPYLEKISIPGRLYQGIPNEIPSMGARVWLVASVDLDDEVVYDVVKTVFEGIEQFRRSDPAFFHLSARKMLSTFVVPFHAGAVKYYKERKWYLER